jgi:hypothetical protein
MDRIVVEVDDAAAKKWRYASEKKRNQLNDTINRIIKNAFEKPEDDFWLFLDKIGKKAEANGLTEEQLNKLLNEE